MPRSPRLLISLIALLATSVVLAQLALVIQPLAERKVTDLPAGALFWRIESYPSREAAQRSMGAWSLVAETTGKIWLFTLGPAGGTSLGGTKVAEVGPITRVSAPQYLLRINEASGPPGEYDCGPQSSWLRGVLRTCRRAKHSKCSWHVSGEARHAGTGRWREHGNAGLQQRFERSCLLVMFVVDATKPFSSPASLP